MSDQKIILSRTPTVADFDLTFESQGTSFIFEDLVSNFYILGEEVSVCINNIKSVYVAKDQIAELNEIGQKVSLAELQSITSSLDQTIAQIVEETPTYTKKDSFNKEDIVHMVGLLGKVTGGYVNFDFCYWDKTFELASINELAREKVELVQNNKNRLRTKFEPVFFGEDSYLSCLINQVSRKTSISKEDLLWYRYLEILGTFDGKKVPAEEIAARKNSYAYYCDKAKVLHFYSGNEAVAFSEQFLNTNSNKSSVENSQIVGKKAHSTGQKITGKVRILSRDYGNPLILQASMAQMETGEIIVSQTTDPELMPALRKAAAIVTDIGGMLSHSAITARELNIPCVVDTKNASKLLKTGDLIEVDTDQGIIKIIKQ